MKEFYIDFSGYCLVKAEDMEQAEETFWKTINGLDAFQHNPYNDVWEIDLITERKLEEDNNVC